MESKLQASLASMQNAPVAKKSADLRILPEQLSVVSPALRRQEPEAHLPSDVPRLLLFRLKCPRFIFDSRL